MNSYIDLRDQDFSFLGKNSSFSGVFNLNGPTHLASQIEGEIYVKNNFELCIEQDGHIQGTIQCHDIDVYGSIEGTLESTGKVTIYPSAKVQGKIKAKDLIIYPGAVVNIDGVAEKEQ